MKNLNSLVSIVVPVYNASEFISQTIQSVIDQTYENWELLLIEDGSTDNSIDIINQYKDDKKIFLLQHPGGANYGVSKSRELGIKVSKGKYVAFLDADDIFYPTKLITQLKIFSELKDVILVHSKVEILNDFELIFENEFVLDNEDKIYKIDEQKNWLIDNKICNSTVMVKSNILKNIQFGLPQLFQYEDWLLWSLIAEKGTFYYLNEPQIKYRIHPASATSNILKNRLVSPYSKIEYLISFYLLNSSRDSNPNIIKQLMKAIVNLFEIYSNGDEVKASCFYFELYNLKGDNEMYVKQIGELYNKYSKLQKEYEELRHRKKSIYFRLLRKIKNIFKQL